VVALEPEKAPTLYRAREAGEPVDVDVSGIAADSLGAAASARSPGRSRSSTCRRRCCCPTKPSAPRSSGCGRNFKLAVEPAAALPLAALQTGAYLPREGEKVCLIVCGANVDPATLA
jgi:threonine dehydratase